MARQTLDSQLNSFLRHTHDLTSDVKGELPPAHGGLGLNVPEVAPANYVPYWTGTKFDFIALAALVAGVITFNGRSGVVVPASGDYSIGQIAGAGALASLSSVANLTPTNSTLTFSGTYDGTTPRNIGLNLANPNTWSGLQTFGTTSGVLISDTAGQLSIGGVTAAHQQFGTTAASGTMVLGMFSPSGPTGPEFRFYRSRSAIIGTAGAAISGSNIAKITGYIAQQTGVFANQNPCCQIRFDIDTTVTDGAAADAPGRIVFATTPDGSGTLVDRFLLNRNGALSVTGNFGTSGQFLRSNTATTNVTWGDAVTSVATDATLIGGPITTSGTLGLNLSNPNTWNQATQSFTAPAGGTAAQFYAADTSPGHILDTWDATTSGSRGFYVNEHAWPVNNMGWKVTKTDYSASSTTMAPISGLSIDVFAGRKYGGYMVVTIDNTTAADGVDFDMNGGSAGFSTITFGFQDGIPGATVGTDWSNLESTLIAITKLPDTKQHLVIIWFQFDVSSDGTFVPQLSVDSSSGGTVKANKGRTWIFCDDMG